MRFGQIPKMLLAGTGAFALCGCGGGGGDMSFIPPPPTATSTPTPTPTPTAIVVFPDVTSTSSTSARGSFNGQFTGPRAEELMARWTAPLHNPSTNTDTQMFGVWVGKK